MKKNFLITLMGAALGASAFAVPNDKPEPPTDKTLSPYFVVLNQDDPEVTGQDLLPLKSTNVDVQISGVIADIEIQQTYHNTGSNVLEAQYVFPGSTRAAVHGMTMKVGDRTIQAKIEERKKAQQIFDQAKAENKTASLLQQQRPNVFQMNVATILPGDLVEVTLRYTEHLVPTDQIYEFVFPTVVGPRYSNTPVGSPQAAADAWVANPFLKEGTENPATFDINVSLQAGMPIGNLACNTHPVKIDYTGPDQAMVSLDQYEPNAGNRDYILRYRLAGDEVASGLLLHEDQALGENFFLLTVQPPKRIKPQHVPAREYVFVVDVSGSMNGFPLNTAKTLMRDLIADLEKRDKFNIVLFAGSSQVFESASVPATSANVSRATRWLDSASAGGGTEMVSALQTSLNLPSSGGISRSIVVVTDGYVSFDREAMDVVRKNLGQANLFAFGIGSSVNRYLIEGLARAGRGEPFVVTKPEEAAPKADQLRNYISAPVLTDIKIDFGGLDVYDVEPASVPDVLADRPITVFGKWRGEPAGEIKLSGVSGEQRRTLTIAATTDDQENPALPYLWARDRIATIADYRWADQQHRGPTKADLEAETKLQITNLGLTYNLLTEFTSFVAVDDVVREGAENLEHTKVKQPAPLPQGVAAQAVGGGAVPEPEFYLLLAIGIGFLAWNQRRLLAEFLQTRI
ncbi:MAG: VIT domain-containing protein [Verrucomicrobiota bacterium]